MVASIVRPGIGDNSAGVAALLTLAELLTQLPAPPVSVWLVANSGEEGLGDLRNCWRLTVSTHRRVGGDRGHGFGPGGASCAWLAALSHQPPTCRAGIAGAISARLALSMRVQLAADLSRLRVPEMPRTTFNIRASSSGRSVNTLRRGDVGTGPAQRRAGGAGPGHRRRAGDRKGLTNARMGAA